MKNKKKKLGKLLFLLLLVLLLGVGGTAFYQKQKQEVPQEESVIAAGENEELVDATILTVVGNEIETKEGGNYTIPVGTEVITKLGNVTTFSRLSSGDKVQLLVGKDTDSSAILKMWIVE